MLKSRISVSMLYQQPKILNTLLANVLGSRKSVTRKFIFEPLQVICIHFRKLPKLFGAGHLAAKQRSSHTLIIIYASRQIGAVFA
ncbi:hypothetical protein C9397_20500 [Xanthomonas vasicola pv. vasculorum]|uniref:Uncharacterized protein n=2 Tax=Xanthomonas vasicola TaxID=56459 RepID=A0ABD7S3Z4_XANVA|nr:hypothetical protein C7V42_16365 [Xanthomonas vasicola pv. vasculorum]AZR27626.1 hypothetical protein NX80_015495 [Xanthomonas vasicola pv. arecae]KEZ96516.1 hypothetical protein A11M_0114810 [Xanthomonas vasicola pv. vasculorum NCPPB 895]KFA35045.1 hypothetical protein KWI_0114585 [Xanthomonas vasicola pv. vasculorum NCPPB 206]TWQ18409.1 hypothetical protein FQK00_16590 [Xanthomonas vasicola]